MKESLYFIAILPDGNLREALCELKLEISKEYNTFHGLKSPPHITLQRPFKRDQDFESEMISALKLFASSQNQFEVLLRGYGAFPPKVIYIKIDDHSQFEAIHKALNSLLRNQLGFSDKELNSKIHPHLTLAHRDLDETNFNRAWKKFKSFKFEATFTAHSICLLRHNGKNWDVSQEFPLNK